MTTPHPGFRRAATVSWSLAGIGVAGVVGASLLAWADTVDKQLDAPIADSVAEPAPATRSAPTTTTMPIAPSYAPQFHTRSRGS